MGVNMQTRGAGRRGERWRPPRPGGPAVPRGRGDERAGEGPRSRVRPGGVCGNGKAP